MASDSYQEGIAAVQAGDFPAAIQAFRRAVAEDPTHTEARYKLAWVLGVSGYLDPALAELEAVVAADPGHVAAHYNRGPCCCKRPNWKQRSRARSILRCCGGRKKLFKR
jgi:tetratricopeptide (TPR) repeat protein